MDRRGRRRINFLNSQKSVQYSRFFKFKTLEITDLAIITKPGRKPQTMRSASLTVSHLPCLILKANALGGKPQAVMGVCLCSKAGKANKLSRLTQIYFLPGNILTKKVDWHITASATMTHRAAVI